MLLLFFVTLIENRYMETYDTIMSLIPLLTISQKQSLVEELKKEKITIHKNELTHCPHCDSVNLIKHSFFNERQRFKCKDCERTFTRTTGTALHGINKQNDFLRYFTSMIEDGFRPLKKMCKEFKISKQTAFDWRQKSMITLQHSNAKFEGITEIDDLWFRYNLKGRQGLENGRKRASKVGAGDNNFQTKILATADRNGQLDMSVIRIGRMKMSDIPRKIGNRINSKTILTSDKHGSISAFAKSFKIPHVSFEAKNHTFDKEYHVQHINSIAERFDFMVNRVFKGVSTKYLQGYANWFKELEVLKNDTSKNELSMDDLLKNNHTWDVFINIENQYERFIDTYSSRTYRCPVKRVRKSQNWTKDVLNKYATY
jgi:transposase-like protein